MPVNQSSEAYWRAECHEYTIVDNAHVYYEAFPIMRRTKQGVTLDVYGKPKKVLERWYTGKATIKRFAWPTKEEALTSLWYRKTKQIALTQSKLATAISELGYIEEEQRHPQYRPLLLGIL
jgi:hypothetical protein